MEEEEEHDSLGNMLSPELLPTLFNTLKSISVDDHGRMSPMMLSPTSVENAQSVLDPPRQSGEYGMNGTASGELGFSSFLECQIG
jgi:hypothetical protein